MAVIQLPYYVDTNPLIAANARYVIREVLADREDGSLPIRRAGHSGPRLP
jgi:hypothetical protein